MKTFKINNTYYQKFKHLNGVIIAINENDNNHFYIQDQNKKQVIYIKNNFEFTYKVQKTQVQARGGAAGLYDFIINAVSTGLMDLLAYKLIDHMFNNMQYSNK